MLALLLDNYEDRTQPSPPPPANSPVEMLKYLMKRHKLKQPDLADIYGGQSVVSEVLRGKREINQYQGRMLSERFKVSIEAFI